MRQMLWVVLVLVALPALAVAASFECEKAATKVEKLICSNDELSKLDEKLSDAYKKSLQRTDIKQKAVVSQRQWLKNVRNPCTVVECVKDAYETRIQEIELMSSFGIVILSAPQNSGGAPGLQKGAAVQPQSTPVIPTKSDMANQVIANAIQPCILPETKGINREDGVLLLMEAIKAKAKLKQYACVVQGMESAHGIIQAMSDGTKRAEWGFELKDVVFPVIKSNELPEDEYEYRLIRAATQSVNDDWSPDMHASEDERLNDATFIGRISDLYAKESQNADFASRASLDKKRYHFSLAMLRLNFTLPNNRRWAETWRIENFFNSTDNRKDYFSDVYKLWSGLTGEDRRIYQNQVLSGVLKSTSGRLSSSYNLLTADEVKRNIGGIQNLLIYVAEAPDVWRIQYEWQVHVFLAEAYWQVGDKESAHKYLENARRVSDGMGYRLYLIAKYLCNRSNNGNFLHQCPYGIYTREEMSAFLDEIERLVATDNTVDYKSNIRWMRKELSDGRGQ